MKLEYLEPYTLYNAKSWTHLFRNETNAIKAGEDKALEDGTEQCKPLGLGPIFQRQSCLQKYWDIPTTKGTMFQRDKLSSKILGYTNYKGHHVSKI